MKKFGWVRKSLIILFLVAYGICVFYVAVNYPYIIGCIFIGLALYIDLTTLRYHLFQETHLCDRQVALIDEPRLTLFLYGIGCFFMIKFDDDVGFGLLMFLSIFHFMSRYIIPKVCQRRSKKSGQVK